MKDLEIELNEFDDDEGYQRESEGQAERRGVISAAAIAELQELVGGVIITTDNYDKELEAWILRQV